MASAIAEGVIGKLTEMIAQQAGSIFTQDFHRLKEELRTLSGFLQNADSLPTQGEDVQKWLHNVRDVAWDAEDIVEECFVRPLYTSSVSQCCVCNPRELFFRCKIGKRIQEVKERIRYIRKDGEKLFRQDGAKLLRHLMSLQAEQPSSSGGVGGVLKENSLLLSNSHLEATQRRVENLISVIEESTASVIALVGIGGVGKTFFLQNVFYRIEGRYEISIWLSISESYSVHKLQCDLATHMGYLKDHLEGASEERAAELIHEYLQGRRSLIVLDDVWRADREDNIIDSLGIPIGSNCKVVVTTRSREVCIKLRAHLYEMESLSEQECWDIFCACAFGGHLPPDLEAIARQVAKKCGRLPLALKTVGFSLSGCTEIEQWEFALGQLSKVNDLAVNGVLKLSYDSLPVALKVCFSYFSFFPEDKKIDCDYLTNLWIAEGFIPQGEDQRDVAWSYLYRLANLCLVEIWEDYSVIKHCKINDLLLDLAVSISRENRCAFDTIDIFTSVKRILLAKNRIDDTVIAQSRSSCLRSLRTLSLYKNPIKNIEENFFSSMRLLRVLDLSKTKISTLPQFVRKLKLLKLLNLSCTDIEEVPICVKSLRSLLFLDLSGCERLQRLPEWISELKCLQHLNITACHHELQSRMPKGISQLVSLQVLRSGRLEGKSELVSLRVQGSDLLRLSVEEDGLLKLEDVAELTRLQEIGLTVRHEKESETIEGGILGKLLSMRRLSIKSEFSKELHLPQNITALKDLETLYVEKFVLPSSLWFSNLRRLVLVCCECSHYPELQALPCLGDLILVGNNSCTEVPKTFGNSSGFPNLRALTIDTFPYLEELPDLEDGAMVALEKFHLIRCWRVKKVPEGLEQLKRLREFKYIMTGTAEFRDTLTTGGDVWNKIRAMNPLVEIRGEYEYAI